MSAIRFSKIVAALPPTLAANTVYLVRVGAGFDLYVTDATGVTAHALNMAAAGSGSATRVVVNVPANVRNEFVATISVAGVTPTSKIMATFAWDGDTDDNGPEELMHMQVFALALAGQIQFTLTHAQGAFIGPFKINYQVFA